jgi:hypothetical protein
MIWFSPAQDGDRPVLRFKFPNIAGQLTTSSVSATVINVATDTGVATTLGTASQSTQDGDYWLYDLADVTGINLETVGEAQLLVVAVATLSSGATIERSQQIWINGARANLDDQVTSRAAPGDQMGLTAAGVDSIFDEVLSGHAVAGSFAVILQRIADLNGGTIEIDKTADPWQVVHYQDQAVPSEVQRYDLYDGDGNAINNANPLTDFVGRRVRA